MNFYTANEFNTMKLYEVDNITYGKIESKFASIFGDKMAKSFLENHLTEDVKKLSANSYVDIVNRFRFF